MSLLRCRPIVATSGSSYKRRLRFHGCEPPAGQALAGDAGAGGDLGVPAPGVGVILRQPDLGGLGRKLNGAERGDVGDAEAWARDEAVVRKLALDASVEAGEPLLAALYQGRNLLDRLLEARQAPAGEGGGRIAEHLRQAGEGLELGAAFPHLDEGAVPPFTPKSGGAGYPSSR